MLYSVHTYSIYILTSIFSRCTWVSWYQNVMSPFRILLELGVMEVVAATGAKNRRAKLQSYRITNIQLSTGWMSFLSPNKQCQCTERKISHSMDLLTPSSPGGLPTLFITYSVMKIYFHKKWFWWKVEILYICIISLICCFIKFLNLLYLYIYYITMKLEEFS